MIIQHHHGSYFKAINNDGHVKWLASSSAPFWMLSTAYTVPIAREESGRKTRRRTGRGQKDKESRAGARTDWQQHTDGRVDLVVPVWLVCCRCCWLQKGQGGAARRAPTERWPTGMLWSGQLLWPLSKLCSTSAAALVRAQEPWKEFCDVTPAYNKSAVLLPSFFVVVDLNALPTLRRVTSLSTLCNRPAVRTIFEISQETRVVFIIVTLLNNNGPCKADVRNAICTFQLCRHSLQFSIYSVKKLYVCGSFYCS